ncbi:MAG: radical SAM protein [Candidatus Pacebacteria bacterium]|nr:radical SAM protein [Candidatus Paceibacterota bacterium]
MLNLCNKNRRHSVKKEGFYDLLFFRSGLEIELTNRCNFNCPHCSRSLSNFDKDLSVSTFEMVLREGKKMNFSTVSLTGGEAILHPRFKEFLKLLKKYDYRFNFVSNGWLYEDYWNDVKDYKDNLAAIFLSLDGATAEIHDAVRNRIGSFDRVIEAIKFYRDKKIPVGINFCITGDNYHQIEKVADLCLELGVKILKSGQLSSSCKKQAVFLKNEDHREFFEAVFNIWKRTKDFLQFSFSPIHLLIDKDSKLSFNFCDLLNVKHIYIDCNGKMFFCGSANKISQNGLSIEEYGFLGSIKKILTDIKEIKKKYLNDLYDNKMKINIPCNYCSKNTEEI